MLNYCNLDFIYLELHTPTTWDARLVPQLLVWKEIFANRLGNISFAITQPRTHSARNLELITRQTTNTSAAQTTPTVPAYVMVMTTKIQLILAF